MQGQETRLGEIRADARAHAVLADTAERSVRLRPERPGGAGHAGKEGASSGIDGLTEKSVAV